MPGSFAFGWDAAETARAYEHFCERHDRYRRANAELLTDAELFSAAQVLDFAAGTGRTAEAALKTLGSDGRVLCVEPARAMRAIGQRRVTDPRVAWFPELPAEGTFDRVLCGAALWQMDEIERVVAELSALVRPGGRLCFTLVASYVGAAEGDDGMAAFAPALARLAKGRAPRAEASFAAPTLERILAALSPLRATTRPFTHRQTAEEYRDWLKIPVLTDALLPDLSPDERARRIDAAFAGLRAEREETWIVVTAT